MIQTYIFLVMIYNFNQYFEICPDYTASRCDDHFLKHIICETASEKITIKEIKISPESEKGL